jgi:hypothetical protein
MLVNIAQFQKIERTACERALSATVKNPLHGRERLSSLRPGRHLTRSRASIARALTAIISGDHAFLLFAHVLLGRLELAAEPLANAGFHGVL